MALQLYNLSQMLEEGHRKREKERNQQLSSDPLIPPGSNLVNSEETSTSGPSVEILTPNNRKNISINDVTQTYEAIGRDNENIAENEENNFNFSAAVLIVLLYIMSIALVVYGCTHLNDCPAEKMIPISYIVLGCLALFSRILSSPEECRKIFKKSRELEANAQTICRACLNLLFQIATICFFCALCYWIFHIHPDTTEGSPNYCEKELYKNTYYGCIVGLSLLGLLIALSCCLCCFAIFAIASNRDGS